MYHSKKIGVFISHIMGHYQKNACQGMIDKAREYGHTTEIFASLDGENLGEYGVGEESILRMPNYSDYSGIIFASDTYPQNELKERILTALKENCTCPIVELSVAGQHFPAVALENNRTVIPLIQHMIDVHNCRRICYLGCSTEAFCSDIRENYYRETLKHSGIIPGSHDIYSCGYSEAEANEAFTFFLVEKTVPEAVICYNDRMALLFMRAAVRAGYQIPDDIAITGCDNTSEGQNVSPALTGVTFPVYELGLTAIDALIKLIHGESVPAVTYVSAAPVFHNSCGCKNTEEQNPIFFSNSLNQRIESLELSILRSMRMSAALSRITDIDDGMDLLEQYVSDIEHCREFYLCLYSDWDAIPSHILSLTDRDDNTRAASGEILLKLAVRDGRRLPECSFYKTSLLPEHIYCCLDSAYIYTPLFFEDREFGYIALAYEENRIDYHFKLVHWFMNISQMLQGICEAAQTSVLVRRLADFTEKDALTGLYNRQGYQNYGKLLLMDAAASGSPVTCFLFDVENLQHINNRFGYSEGNFVLEVIGRALTGILRPEDICARFYGDDFYLLTGGYTKKDAEDLLARVHKYLDNYNRLSSKDYQIHINSGFAAAPAGSILTLELADELFAAAAREINHKKY